jgi:hypothetical protein
VSYNPLDLSQVVQDFLGRNSVWAYESADERPIVDGAAYFSDARDRGFKIGDLLLRRSTVSGSVSEHSLVFLDSVTGAGSLSRGDPVNGAWDGVSSGPPTPLTNGSVYNDLVVNDSATNAPEYGSIGFMTTGGSGPITITGLALTGPGGFPPPPSMGQVIALYNLDASWSIVLTANDLGSQPGNRFSAAATIQAGGYLLIARGYAPGQSPLTPTAALKGPLWNPILSLATIDS